MSDIEPLATADGDSEFRPQDIDVTGDHPPVHLGVVGLGGFARFALQHFLQVPGARLVCVGGTSSDEAKHCAERYGAPVLESASAVMTHPEVDWVYINTPPFLHADQAREALENGKNVLVEKPLATCLDDARELLELAESKGLRLMTNLMQRYNPVVDTIQTILDRRLLGEPLFFSITNHAVDEGLGTNHWFWDESKSGGIFVEHGVHFFDLATHWFGPGEVQTAGRQCRAIDGAEDQVWCDARHGSTVARFYHGFNQSGRTEAQRWEIVCERGQMTMEGWIPLGVQTTAIVTESQMRTLADLPGVVRHRTLEQYPADQRSVRAHGKMHDVFQKVRMQIDPGVEKAELYGDLLVRLFAEQTDTRRSPRILDVKGGYDSLAMAVQATKLARG